MKVHVTRMTRGGAKACALHLKYIQRDGVEQDGSAGVLYTSNGLANAADFEEPRAGEKHQFRFIFAPEDGEQLDMTDYVQRYMARVEKDVGRKLEWAAVNHYDTEHPHAHIVVRGVDRDGLQVRFDRAYVSEGLRSRAQELATQELGPRLERDLERTRQREITQERLTSLDRDLERRAVDGRVEITSRETKRGVPTSVLIARLKHLERMRLATRLEAGRWALSPNWQRDLRELGMRGDILKQMHKALSGDPSRYRILQSGPAKDGAPKESLSGRVVAKGLSDELKGTYYAVVETADKRAYHLPVDPRSFDAVRVGDAVTVGGGEDAKRAFTLRKQEKERRERTERER